jgi:hypothetical protein
MWRADGDGIIMMGDAKTILRSAAARAQISGMGLRDATEPLITAYRAFSAYDRGPMVIEECFFSGDIRVR